jgi:hypothetical protein
MFSVPKNPAVVKRRAMLSRLVEVGQAVIL